MVNFLVTTPTNSFEQTKSKQKPEFRNPISKSLRLQVLDCLYFIKVQRKMLKKLISKRVHDQWNL